MVFWYFRTGFLRLGKRAGLPLSKAPTRSYAEFSPEARKSLRRSEAGSRSQRVASAAQAARLCAGHAQQLGGESPPANLMEVKA